jgi:hypothetical protein
MEIGKQLGKTFHFLGVIHSDFTSELKEIQKENFIVIHASSKIIKLFPSLQFKCNSFSNSRMFYNNSFSYAAAAVVKFCLLSLPLLRKLLLPNG